MTELLIEIFSEEIPARMQKKGTEDFKRLVLNGLKKNELPFDNAKAFVTPRRLILTVDGLPESQADVKEERKGPNVNAPEQAVNGFLKSIGMTLDQVEKRQLKKGEFYFAVIERKGRPAIDVLKEVIEQALADMPWQKSMRWGTCSTRWVRPLHSMICLFGGKVIPVEFARKTAGNATVGHRFMSPAEIIVEDFADYENKLRNAFVMIDREERKELILGVSRELAEQKDLVLLEDAELLEEVAGLVEWAVPLMGSIDEEFMDIPAEALTSSMKKHQKYFSVTDKQGNLAPYFMFVSNMETEDGGKAITVGNERVLKARLSDAKFFWDNDRKAKLETRVAKLKDRIFHAKLGTDYERVQRIMNLAEHVAKHIIKSDLKKGFSDNKDKIYKALEDWKDPVIARNIYIKNDVRRAAELCKADLSTEMVGEFPDLQGTMGKYYAIKDGEKEHVANAIEEHYSPLGPNDKCPSAPVSVAVALADKIDSLVGFWRIDMKPTGSKDPYALRRAALGVIRLIRENELSFDLKEIFDFSDELYGDRKNISEDLFRFFVDRLKVYLKGIGMRHDLIDAVLGKKNYDISNIISRAEALRKFIESDDGSNLLIAFRRAVNIVRIEEKKDGKSYDSIPDENAFIQEEEKNLWKSIEKVGEKCKKALEQNNFEEAMLYMANLRKPVDEFFDRVTVNSDDNNLRINRLGLLTQVKKVMQGAAYFSKIEG